MYNAANQWQWVRKTIVSRLKNDRTRTLLPAFTTKDQILFARRLSVYLSAGVPILEALTLLSKDARTKGVSSAIQKLAHEVSEGRTLAMALQDSSMHAHSLTFSMIEIGERTGTLAESLAYLATTLRQQAILKNKLLGSLAYPFIIVLTTLALAAFLMLYAFPKITPLFRGFDTTLPFTTRALISVSDTLSQHGLLLLGLLGAGTLILWFLMHKPRTRNILDLFILRLPLFGPLMRGYVLAHLSRTLSTLLHNGVSIAPALELVSVVSRNSVYAQALLRVRDDVVAGERLADSLTRNERCFPRMYTQMVGTGERTGSLVATLYLLTDHYEEEFDETSRSITTLIEPALMLCMGILVGFIALAIITPVYQITQDIHV